MAEEQKKLDNLGHQTPQVFSFRIISFCMFYYFLIEEFIVISQFLSVGDGQNMVEKAICRWLRAAIAPTF
ncbi:MAG: hypothetical protein VKL20_01665 [Synechocystis sp.]|nr:hypothetical protein [Synechocystis sp.]